MSIFKKNTVETSNDVYEAYKAELSGDVERKSFFSLANIIKLEVVVVALGLFFMNQNHLSLELTSVNVAKNEVLPVSVQIASLDKDLVVTQEEETAPFEKVKIREENQNELVATNVVDKKTYLENEDMKLLIELLQSEVEEKVKSEVKSTNRLIISQK